MLVQKSISHQPGARSFQSKNQIGRSGPSRSAPAAECGLRTRSLHNDGESELRSLTGARVPPVTRLSNQVTILGPRCSAQSVLATLSMEAQVKGSGV